MKIVYVCIVLMVSVACVMCFWIVKSSQRKHASEDSLTKVIRPEDDDMPFEFLAKGKFDGLSALHWRMYNDHKGKVRVLVIYSDRACATTVLPLVHNNGGD